MNNRHDKRILDLMMAALDHEDSAREAFLREACAGDEALLATVCARLAHDEDGFFKDPPSPATEDQIDDYTLGEELGSGGMGTVYLARHPFQGRVALKILKPGMDTTELIRRFHRERQILSRLAHPNIARLLDGGVTPRGRPYFVMEYIPGEPIHHYCDQRKLTIDERLALFRGVCSAVETAHRHLIVHRDIKPANILVTEEGVPKLLDFGIARLLDGEGEDEATVTALGARFLTLEYASPEQVTGMPASTSCDVYSLGVLLYELLTGHRPLRLRTRTLEEAQRAHGRTRPSKPSEIILSTDKRKTGEMEKIIDPKSVSTARETTPRKLRGKLSGDLDKIALKALRKEAARRYASAADLDEDVRRYMENRPVRARGDSVMYHAGKFIGRHKTAVLIAGLLVLVPLSFFGARKLEERKIQKERERAALSNSATESLSGAMDALLKGYLNVNRQDASYDVTDDLTQALTNLRKLPLDQLAAGEPADTLLQLIVNTGSIYCGRGMKDRALQTYSFGLDLAEAMKSDPHIGMAAFYKGHTFIELGRLEEAAPLVRQGLNLVPENETWLAARSGVMTVAGWFLFAGGDDLGEAECFTRIGHEMGVISGLDGSKMMINRFIYGAALFHRGRYQEAAAIYAELQGDSFNKQGDIRLFYLDHQVHLAELSWLYGEEADAMATVERVKNQLLDPSEENSFVQVSLGLAGVCLEMGHIGFARSLLAEAEAATNRQDSSRLDFNFARVRGELALADGNLNEALAQYRLLLHSMRRQPDSWRRPMVYQAYARILIAAGETEEAATILEKAKGSAAKNHLPGHPVFGLLKAREAALYGALGMGRQAETRFQEALELFQSGELKNYPRIADIYRSYADYHEKNGNGRRARELRKQAEEHLTAVLGRPEIHAGTSR